MHSRYNCVNIICNRLLCEILLSSVARARPRSVSSSRFASDDQSVFSLRNDERFLRGKCHIFLPLVPARARVMISLFLFFLSARWQIESHNYPSCVTPTFLRGSRLNRSPPPRLLQSFCRCRAERSLLEAPAR